MATLKVTAEEEFAKNPELKEADLKQLRSWLKTQSHLPYISVEQLILFLHSCYYSIPRTKNCIEAFYSLRMSSPELFTKRELQLVESQRTLSALYYAELPVKDPNGNHIIYHALKVTDPSKYNFPVALKIFIMMIESCLVFEGTSPGMVFLMDAQGVRFGHITRLSLSLVRKSLRYFQEAIPVRLKAIHVVNVVPMVDQIMTLIKPFMSKELHNLIHFHKGNNETLSEYLPKECLPKHLGGDLPTATELHDAYIPKLESIEDYFKEEEKFLADEIRRNQKETFTNDPPESAMKSLCID